MLILQVLTVLLLNCNCEVISLLLIPAADLTNTLSSRCVMLINFRCRSHHAHPEDAFNIGYQRNTGPALSGQVTADGLSMI